MSEADAIAGGCGNAIGRLYHDSEKRVDNLRICVNYDYKQKSNLFGLDALYRSMPKKSFTRGKKQEFEAVLLHCWLHEITSDDAYWDIYAEQVL